MTKNSYDSEDVGSEVESVLIKKEKKKKTGEERSKDRGVVFFVLFSVIVVTIAFWLKAKLLDKNRWDNKKPLDDSIVNDKNDDGEDNSFYVKFKI